jgi:alpha-galactosidase
MFSALSLIYVLRQVETPFLLEDLDLSSITQGYGEPHRDRSVGDNALKIAGTTYAKGLGTHAVGEAVYRLDGNATSFSAVVGVDDETDGKGSVKFLVYVDGKLAASSPVMKSGQPAYSLSVNLKGAKTLKLVTDDAGDGIDFDHADWIAPTVSLLDPSKPPTPFVLPVAPPYPIAPVDRVHTRINGARIVGVTPGHELVFRVPVSGEQPLKLEVRGLPKGLVFDPKEGVVSGVIKSPGEFNFRAIATGPGGTASRTIHITAGFHKLALTPPMGWNSWNVWAGNVDAEKVRAAADAFVKTGLADFGYTYVNIDDTWEGQRDAEGGIQTNEKFPDMASLSTYIHGLGLKIGIYSSPGPTTCAGYPASWQHEEQDAKTYAKWGMDYLKYDWCSYGGIDPHPDLAGFKKPYEVMRKAMDDCDRDIVFSLCQYGMGDVYKWGYDIGGNLWRTTGDINDSWSSMSGIGFSHSIRSPYVKPGGWNDPDMLVVGRVGWGTPHPSRLKPNEQITHISLWALLAAPLIIGCDLERIDDFTQRLLMNPEVIDIDQDRLGKAAVRVKQDGDLEVWARPLEDGSIAVGLFNRGADAASVKVDRKDLGKLKSGAKIRDVWRLITVGKFGASYSQEVPAHGAILLRIG